MNRLDRILLATDLGPTSDDSWRETCEVAKTFGSEVIMVHAIPTSERSVDFELLERAALDEHFDLRILAQAEQVKLREIPLVRSGQVHEVVLEAAEEVDADLVVLGAGRKSTVERILLGSSAELISRECDRPVLLVRPGKPQPHPGFHQVACAVDASEPAREALASAIFLARTFVAKLTLVTVVDPRLADTLGAEEVKLRGCMEAYDLHGLDVEFVVRDGKPAVEILEVVHEVGSDVLVMGSAGRKGVARLMRGNTAEKIMRVVPCSLLTVQTTGRT